MKLIKCEKCNWIIITISIIMIIISLNYFLVIRPCGFDASNIFHGVSLVISATTCVIGTVIGIVFLIGGTEFFES